MVAVYVVGVAVLDFVYMVDKFPSEEEKCRAEDARIGGGGCAANAAVAISRLGGEAILTSRLGDDLIGDLIVSGLAEENVDPGLINRAADAKSSFSSVYVDRKGRRQIVSFPGKGLSQETSWMEEPATVDAVLTDTRWTAGALHALELARRRGLPGIVDGEAPIDPTVLSLASHMAFSLQGLQSLTSERSPARALEEIRRDLPAWACVTDGGNGVFYTAGKAIEHIPAFEVDVKDTLAAGDIWHGAFALRLGEGADEPTAITFANAAAALKCMSLEGRSGCPSRSLVNEFLTKAQR